MITATALTAAIGVSACSAMHASDDDSQRPFAALFHGASQARTLHLASHDDDDDHRVRGASSHRDHDDECDDDEGDDDDCGPVVPVAPLRPVAPPQNGLFGTGAPPRVRVN
jgi:hypothetical protein